MAKLAKITIEFDGQKNVFVTDLMNMHQNRDLQRYPDPERPGKTKFKPGDSTLVIVAFRPVMVPEECNPVPTLERALGLTTDDPSAVRSLKDRSVFYVESFHKGLGEFFADSYWNGLKNAEEQRDLLHERSERVRIIEEATTCTIISEDGPGCICGADDDPPDKALPHKTWCPKAIDESSRQMRRGKA